MKANASSIKKTRFESIGTYLPEKVLSTKELMARGEADFFKLVDLEEITGIENRHVRSECEDSFTLAMDAAKDCLRHSKYEARDLDIIIYGGITQMKGSAKQFLYEPAMSLYIKNKLGAESAMNIDISNGCAGMLNGVYILDAMIKSGTVRNGMVVSGECITSAAEAAIKEIDNVFDEQFASLTLGDAGAAVILDGTPDDGEGIEFTYFLTAAEHAELCIALPSEQGNGIVMYTKAKEIHDAAIEMFAPILDEALSRNGKDIDDIDYCLAHQTSTRALASAGKKMHRHFNREVDLLVNVPQYGNTASTTHFVAMHRYLKNNTIKKGTRILLAAQASGLVLGCVLATIGNMGADNGYCH